MFTTKALTRGLLAVALVASAVTAHAEIVIDTVPVGNTGNTGEWSGQSYGGYGPNRLCGAVNYAYNIGKYEVTAGQYTAFLNTVAATDTYGLYSSYMADPVNLAGCNIQRSGLSGSYTYTVASDYANRPVNWVSWGDAARFVNWLNNGQKTIAQDASVTEHGAYNLSGATSNAALLAVTRQPGWKWAIPTEDEWYKAAYHKNDGDTGNYFDYPTSSNTAPGQDMADPLPGNNANYQTPPDIYPIDSGKYTTLAGEFQNSDSPYGTFDQGGNVLEWNESILYGSSRGLRGGSFSTSAYTLAASFRDHRDPPAIDVQAVGFRVANVPEPAGIAMLLSGAATLLIWRKRRKR